MMTTETFMSDFVPRLLAADGTAERETLAAYVNGGGYAGLSRMDGVAPETIVSELREAGLRGRGGAAFPVWLKWQSMLGREAPTYVVANGEEGEPGSLKDRTLMARRPHLVLEGVLIACRAIGSQEAVLYLSEDFTEATASLEAAIGECRESGRLATPDGKEIRVRFTHVPHSYVAGEETAALQAIEGHPAKPRFKPPRPFEAGLFGRPTLVQNVETLACIALLFGRGPRWYREVGTEESPGTLLLSLAGDVERPGVYEVPFGVPLGSIVEGFGGGIRHGATVAAVMAGGYFSGFQSADVLEAPYSYEGMALVGGTIGSANVTVISTEDCSLRKAQAVTAFFATESCRQCGPCMNGTSMIDRLMQQILKGKGKPEYVERVGFLANHVRRHGACAHLDGGAAAAASLLRVLDAGIQDHLRGACRICVPARA